MFFARRQDIYFYSETKLRQSPQKYIAPPPAVYHRCPSHRAWRECDNSKARPNGRGNILREIGTVLRAQDNITQYTSTGRIELAIPTRYSELRNEMMTILKQQGIHPQKLKDNYTGQYFLSFPQTRSSLNFVKTLKHARLSTVPNDYMPVKNTQRT